MSEISVLDVNQATLDLFCAPDRQTLLQRLGDIFRKDMEKNFREQLIKLWNGELFHHLEVVNYALDGTERYVLLHFSVFPGYEEDWSLVQVSLTDITARKKAEAYLEYLGKHDVLTKLHNRAFYTDELNRLERKSLRPISAIIIDVNGLKEANDQLGHDAGDMLLRRMGEVLNGVLSQPNHAARIGGDEFAVLMPGADRQAAAAMLETIHELMKINNQFYSKSPLSISCGMATSEPGESMESLIKRADLAMYEAKAGGRGRVAAARRCIRQLARSAPERPRLAARPFLPAPGPRIDICRPRDESAGTADPRLKIFLVGHRRGGVGPGLQQVLVAPAGARAQPQRAQAGGQRCKPLAAIARRHQHQRWPFTQRAPGNVPAVEGHIPALQTLGQVTQRSISGQGSRAVHG